MQAVAAGIPMRVAQGADSQRTHARTLAKQQQTSECVASVSGELSADINEPASTAEKVKRAATQIATGAEDASGAAQKSLAAVTEVPASISRQMVAVAQAQRMGHLTLKLDEDYVDMRQFYEMLMTAVTGHNTELDRGLGLLLDTAQNQDVVKQIVDRVQPAMDSRNAVLADLIARLRAGEDETLEIDRRAGALAQDYLEQEALHRDPEAAGDAAPGAPSQRIELF